MEQAVELLSRFFGLSSESVASPPISAFRAQYSAPPKAAGPGTIPGALSQEEKSMVGRCVSYGESTSPVGGKDWEEFSDFIRQWAENFDQEGPQPDRYELLRGLSESPSHGGILAHIAALGSLQVAVKAVLPDVPLDFVEQISGNMVQVSHATLPELALYYDISSKWRRTA